MKFSPSTRSAPAARRAAAALAASLALGAMTPGVGEARAATVFVKSLGDSGPGTLRVALTFANAHPNSTVAFAVPRALLRGGVATIRPATALPIISANGTRIDGTSQARFVGDTNAGGPEVVLDGSRLLPDPASGRPPRGLVIEAARCRLSGLVVQNCAGAGVVLRGKRAFENRVAGCYIGTDASGKQSRPNGYGLVLQGGAHHNQVGGDGPSARNLISGNEALGIGIFDAGTGANRVQNCFIGVDTSGRAKLPNGVHGIQVTQGPSGNTIGGVQAGERNVISGNGSDGVAFIGAQTRRNVVQGNVIGLDVSGAVALGNVKAGVDIAGATENLIGGAQAGAGNVISGNYVGINIIQGASKNTVQGNLVGTDAAGARAVPNINGVWVRGANDNLIGGSVSGARNVLSGNAKAGIWVGADSASANRVQGNIVGLDSSGARALPNGLSGVGLYEGALDNLIGGAAQGEGNLIAGNTQQGVAIQDAATAGNRVQGNRIGLGSGDARLPNGLNGVGIYSGAHNNIIGGAAPGQANTIAYSLRAIAVDGPATTGNQTEGNTIDPIVIGQWAAGQTSPTVASKDWDATASVKEAGEYVVRFQFMGGADQLNIESVELLENGRSVARDAHAGSTGFQNANNEYRLKLPALAPGATYTLRASVASPSGANSGGEVQMRREGAGA